MSILAAKRLGRDDTTPIQFSTRGYNSYTASTISNLVMKGVPWARQPAYDSYTMNIDAFVAATDRKEKIVVSLEGFGLLSATSHLALTPPVCVVKPSMKLTSQQLSDFASKLSKEAVVEHQGKQAFIRYPNCTINHAIRLVNQVDSNFSRGSVTANPSGVLLFHVLCNWIGAFVATNTYPAFNEANAIQRVPGSAIRIGSRVADEIEEKEESGRYVYLDEARGYELKVREAKSNASEDNGEMNIDEPEITGFYEYELNNVVIHAKPSPGSVSDNCGPPSQTPSLPGLCFPYFDGMVLPDSTWLKVCLTKYLFRNLGRSRQECQESIKRLRLGVNSLANTTRGRELAHMFLGVELSLETQTRLYLYITDDTYKGFSLLGASFSIFNGSSWVDSETQEVLREQALRLNTHDRSIQELARLFSGMSLKSGDTIVEVGSETLKCAKDIIDQILMRKVDDLSGEDRALFDKSVRGVQWEKPYQAVTIEHLEDMLHKLYIDKVDPDNDMSMFIPGIGAPVNDRRFLWLSTFGPDAPSLWSSIGTEYPIRGLAQEKNPGEKRKRDEAKYEGMPDRIRVALKPIYVAFDDWKKMEENRSIQMNLKERAGPFRCIEFSSPDAVQRLWGKLVESKDNFIGKGKGKKVDVPVASTSDFSSLMNMFS